MKTPCTFCEKRTTLFVGGAITAIRTRLEWKRLDAIQTEGATRANGYASAILSKANVRGDVAIIPVEWREQCRRKFPVLVSAL